MKTMADADRDYAALMTERRRLEALWENHCWRTLSPEAATYVAELDERMESIERFMLEFEP